MAKKPLSKRVIPYVLGFLVVGTVSGGIYSLIGYFEKPIQSRKTVQQISIIQPPPPPPREEPPPPPPPEVEEEVKIPEPEEIPQDLPDMADQPPADTLGLDADGGAGSDGFGLAARKGGRGLLGGGGDPEIRFASSLKNKIQDVLSEYEGVKARNYKVVVSFKISDSGQLSPMLRSSTGDPVVDSTLKQALEHIASIVEQPPSEVLGKTIRFRIGV